MTERLFDQTVFDDTQSSLREASHTSIERPVLIVLEGGDFKTRYTIDEASMVLGRDLGCQIILSDVKSSRRHAELNYLNFDEPTAEPCIQLKDLGSTNGTYLNGQKLDRSDLKDGDKIMIGSTLFGFFLRDEKALKADEMLIRLASIDALTGLHNRGVFNLEIKREADRARRYRRDLSLVMFDIDHFKRFNDTYGHQLGDDVLREIGGIVTYNCRSNDLAARYGGEEFAILLPETPLENALIQAERLRKSIASHSFTQEATRISVTVSVGLAMLEDQMEGEDDLIEAADQALYRAKDAGRNQVCWHNGRLISQRRLGETIRLTNNEKAGFNKKL